MMVFNVQSSKFKVRFRTVMKFKPFQSFKPFKSFGQGNYGSGAAPM
jgi:hypothetical protein